MQDTHIALLVVLGLMAGSIIGALWRKKNPGKANGCEGCPNYSRCRAHLGCANNPNRKR